MKLSNENIPKKYFLYVVVIALLIISFFIVRPYITILISSLILAFLIKPVFDILKKRLGKRIAALLSILIIILVLVLPLGVLLGEIGRQATLSIDKEGFKQFLGNIENNSFIKTLNIDLHKLTGELVSYLVSSLKNTALQIPSIILSIIVLFFSMFYFLTEWDELTKKLRDLIPFEEKEQISKDLGMTTKNIVYGIILISILEFIVAAIGFYISGVELYLLFATIIAILVFIPGLGPIIVWIPLAIYHFVVGNIISAVGIVITGSILSFYFDGVLVPKMLGKKANIHPLIMIVGIFGGMAMFGIFGFIIGPIILSYTVRIIDDLLN